jgi:hypothetical protein
MFWLLSIKFNFFCKNLTSIFSAEANMRSGIGLFSLHYFINFEIFPVEFQIKLLLWHWSDNTPEQVWLLEFRKALCLMINSRTKWACPANHNTFRKHNYLCRSCFQRCDENLVSKLRRKAAHSVECIAWIDNNCIITHLEIRCGVSIGNWIYWTLTNRIYGPLS